MIWFGLLMSIALLLPNLGISQQKIGYIDSEGIMKKLPEAQDAQKKLDGLVEEWKKELDKMQNDFRQRYERYDKKKLIMTDQGRAQAEKDLQQLDQKIQDFRNQKFGPEGEMYQKQNELMKPIQDKVFLAVKQVAEENSFDYVFDRSGTILLLYTNDKYDLTAKVLAKLQQP
jgi:outer membrane protein